MFVFRCPGRYMRLDSAAMRALNVLKSKTDSSDTFSLYGLLNRGKTPMGKRLLKASSEDCVLPLACQTQVLGRLPGFWDCDASRCMAQNL